MTFLRNALPILIICLSFGLSAQSPADYVPQDVSFAVSFHPGHLNEKVNIREMQQMPFYQMMVEEIAKMAPSRSSKEVEQALLDLQGIGINDLADVYFFSKMTDEVTYYGFTLGLSDASKFASFFTELTEGEMKMENVDGYKFLQVENDVAFGWTNNALVIASAEVKYNWWDVPYEESVELEDMGLMESFEIEELEEVEEMPEFEDHDIEAGEEIVEMPMEEEEPVVEEIIEHTDDSEVYDDFYSTLNTRNMEETENWAKSILSRNFGSNINSHSKYSSATSDGADVNFWMDYAAFPAMMGGDTYGGGMGSGMLGMPATMMADLYDGMFFNMGMNFDEGQVNVDMEVFGNEEMLDMWKGSYKSKYNKKLASYVDASELLGYFHINLNVENLMEGYKDMFYPIMESMPEMGSMSTAAMDALGIIIDDEALYELFSGDAIMAFTGLSEFTRTVITYEYDDDFNPVEVEKEIKEYFPEFSFMAGYGNEENILKLVRLVEAFGLAQNMGNYYSMQIPEVPGDFYIAMENDILFFSNDMDLIGNRLNTGFPKDRMLSKSHFKSMKKSASNFFWDIPNTMSLISTSGLPMGGAPGEFLNVGKQNFQSLSFDAPKKVGDSAKMKMTLQLVDEEENALLQMADLVNELFMDMMGGDSRS